MSTKRLLLPFTGSLDAQALNYAVKLAQCEQATLTLLSLIVVPSGKCARGVRLERIQQSKDFLVFAASKARRGGVPVETHEVYAYDAVLSLTLLAQEQMCDAVLLFVRNREGVLLQTDEVKRMLGQQSISCCLICIPVPQHVAVWTRLARWWRKPDAEEAALHGHISPTDKDIASLISAGLIEPGYVMSWLGESSLSEE